MPEMTEINREHKDRLFSFLFGEKGNREWTLSLYNAVNGTSHTDPDSIEFTTMEDAVYMGMKNDVSFLLCQVMNVYEQQSTWNPNMPVRQLMYAAKLYDKYIHQRRLNIYGKKPVRLPVPRLVSCPAHISQNDLSEFPSAALLSVNDATASSPSAALQTENSSCAILLKVNGTRH